MKTLLFTKTGGSVYFPDLPTKRQTGIHSDVGEVAAALQWLHRNASRLGIKLAFYGRPTWQERGVEDPLPGLEIVTPTRPPHRTPAGLVDPVKQQDWLDAEMGRLPAGAAVLEFSGSVFGWGYGCDQSAYSCMSSAECALPISYFCHKTSANRMTIMSDALRCYPQQKEMLIWPGARPCALMGMLDGDPLKPLVRGPFKYVESKIGVSNWFTDVRKRPPLDLERNVPFIMTGHSHVGMGYRNAKRKQIYKDLRLDLLPETCRIYGEGWENVYPAGPKFPGPCEQNAVAVLLARGKCALTMSPMEQQDCITTQLRWYSWCGVAPILYGFTEPHALDRGERYVPMNSGWRAATHEQLLDILSWSDTRKSAWAEYVESITQPDYGMLEQLVLDGVSSSNDSMRQRYGGVSLK